MEINISSYDLVLVPSYRQRNYLAKQLAVQSSAGNLGTRVETFASLTADLWELYGDGTVIINNIDRRLFIVKAFIRYAQEHPEDAGKWARPFTVTFQHSMEPGKMITGFESSWKANEDEGSQESCCHPQTETARPQHAGNGEEDGGACNSEQQLEAASLMRIAEKLVRQLSGLEAHLDACLGSQRVLSSLHPREAAVLEVVRIYFDTIQREGFIESNEALMRLSDMPQASQQFETAYIADFPRLTLQQKAFIQRASTRFGAAPQMLQMAKTESLPAETDLRFAFSTGRYATAQALLAETKRRVSAGDTDILLVCPNPTRLSQAMQGALISQGICCQTVIKDDFSDLPFGRWAISALTAVSSSNPSKSLASDCLLSPFSGISRQAACKANAKARNDRLEPGFITVLNALEQSPLLAKLAAICNQETLAEFHNAMLEHIDEIKEKGISWKETQRAALFAFTSVMSRAFQLGVPRELALQVLLGTVVNSNSKLVPAHAGSPKDTGETQIAQEMQDPQAPQQAQDLQAPQQAQETQTPQPDHRAMPTVTFATQSVAKEYHPKAFDSVLYADLSNEHYSIASKEDAADLLLQKLSVPDDRNLFDEARKAFNSVTALARKALVLHRTLYDDDGEETVPAMVLEEFTDTYRPNITATADISNLYRLPPNLQQRMSLYSEGEFAESFTPAMEPLPIAGRTRLEEPSRVTGRHLDNLLGRLSPYYDGRLAMSPSRIETYISCPYRWLASSKLKIQALDEQFSHLEKGTYAHAVMQRFYHLLQTEGRMPKVTPDNLLAASAIMEKAIAQVNEEQPALEPCSGRYVPIDPIEDQQVEDLHDNLRTFVDFEAKFLPTFHPAYLEYEIPVDKAVEYAGMKVFGKVDRIDVDSAGNAIIIDYKNSIKPAHALAALREETKDMRKVSRRTAEAEDDSEDANDPKAEKSSAGSSAKDSPVFFIRLFNGKLKGLTLKNGKVQALVYAQIICRHLNLNVVGALYVSSKHPHEVSGAIDGRAVEAAHLPNRKPGCTLSADIPFHDLLDAVEAQIEEEMQDLYKGSLPRRASDNCIFCDCSACPKRGN